MSRGKQGSINQLMGGECLTCATLKAGVKALLGLTLVVSYAYLYMSASVSAEAMDIEGVVAPISTTTATNKTPDEACEAPDSSNNAPASKRNQHGSCLVSLSTIDKLRNQKGFSFVDVRTPAEYERYRIAESINIPLHLVKTKSFLKTLPFVLVSDGRTTIDLEKACGDLRQAGFDHAAVLEGGLFAWHASKRHLEGDPLEQAKLNRMSASELFEERGKSNLTVIDISSSGKRKDIHRWLPAKIVAIPMTAKGDSIARISSNISQLRKKNPHARVILIGEDNASYERVDARLQKSGIASSVLRLDGGIVVYREFVSRQLAIWDQQKKPKEYQACRG